MHAHIVLAHPEGKSYNGHLALIARRTLEGQGWTTTLSDLYGMGFDPCERGGHYSDPHDPHRFDAQAEQRRASDNGTLPDHVAEEIANLDRADLVILQYPMWWHLPPAILKGWMDRVFVYGDVYTSKKRFENGRYVGKRAMISVTVATSEATYAHDGRSGDIDLLLWPVHFSLAYVGMTVLKPFVGYGVESSLRYSEDSVIEARLRAIDGRLVEALTAIDDRPSLRFNRMEEWGADGRIKPGAPVHSPFMRRRKHLELE